MNQREVLFAFEPRMRMSTTINGCPRAPILLPQAPIQVRCFGTHPAKPSSAVIAPQREPEWALVHGGPRAKEAIVGAKPRQPSRGPAVLGA
jgi:hypothetical protein